MSLAGPPQSRRRIASLRWCGELEEASQALPRAFARSRLRHCGRGSTRARLRWPAEHRQHQTPVGRRPRKVAGQARQRSSRVPSTRSRGRSRQQPGEAAAVGLGSARHFAGTPCGPCFRNAANLRATPWRPSIPCVPVNHRSILHLNYAPKRQIDSMPQIPDCEFLEFCNVGGFRFRLRRAASLIARMVQGAS